MHSYKSYYVHWALSLLHFCYHMGNKTNAGFKRDDTGDARSCRRAGRPAEAAPQEGGEGEWSAEERDYGTHPRRWEGRPRSMLCFLSLGDRICVCGAVCRSHSHNFSSVHLWLVINQCFYWQSYFEISKYRLSSWRWFVLKKNFWLRY